MGHLIQTLWIKDGQKCSRTDRSRLVELPRKHQRQQEFIGAAVSFHLLDEDIVPVQDGIEDLEEVSFQFGDAVADEINRIITIERRSQSGIHV